MIVHNDLKIHIVLLDNRFDYDRETGDRLGDNQWDWLNFTIRNQSDSDLTLIVAGIQMIRDNAKIDEHFQWENKVKLLDIIE